VSSVFWQLQDLRELQIGRFRFGFRLRCQGHRISFSPIFPPNKSQTWTTTTTCKSSGMSELFLQNQSRRGQENYLFELFYHCCLYCIADVLCILEFENQEGFFFFLTNSKDQQMTKKITIAFSKGF
jgi:hypothetical protein